MRKYHVSTRTRATVDKVKDLEHQILASCQRGAFRGGKDGFSVRRSAKEVPSASAMEMAPASGLESVGSKLADDFDLTAWLSTKEIDPRGSSPSNPSSGSYGAPSKSNSKSGTKLKSVPKVARPHSKHPKLNF